MKRSVLKRRRGLDRGATLRRKRPDAVTAAVVEARLLWHEDLGACVICPAEGGVCDGPVEGHHALDKETLKRAGLHEFLWDVRGRVPVCRFRHEQHTSAYRPIPRELLPASVFELADAVGLSWWLDKHYRASEAAAA